MFYILVIRFCIVFIPGVYIFNILFLWFIVIHNGIYCFFPLFSMFFYVKHFVKHDKSRCHIRRNACGCSSVCVYDMSSCTVSCCGCCCCHVCLCPWVSLSSWPSVLLTLWHACFSLQTSVCVRVFLSFWLCGDHSILIYTQSEDAVRHYNHSSILQRAFERVQPLGTRLIVQILVISHKLKRGSLQILQSKGVCVAEVAGCVGGI